MAKQLPASESYYAQAVKASNIRPSWVTQPAQNTSVSAWPYSANFVWQDTTSNATYCSASAALSQSKTDGPRL